MAETALEEQSAEGGVDEYLRAPRKKRRNYSILAVSSNVSAETYAAIEGFIKESFNGLTIARPRGTKELQRLLNRQISVLIIDDGFAGIEKNIELIKLMKEKRREAAVPVLFLTENPGPLIQLYNKELLAYNEMDNYIEYRRTGNSHLLEIVKGTLSPKTVRRSRRFPIELPVRVYFLADGDVQPGVLLDISLHGGIIELNDRRVLSSASQLKVHIPTSRFLPVAEGDFLRVSGRIRRVFMAGSKAAISWEHVSPDQFLRLTRFVTELVTSEMRRR